MMFGLLCTSPTGVFAQAAKSGALAGKVDLNSASEAELVELTWLPIAAARELDIPPVTKRVLTELEARVAAGFGHDLPVPI